MPSATQAWEAALGALQVEVSPANFHTWLGATAGLSYDGRTFVVGVPNAFVAEWLEKRLLSLISHTLNRVLDQEIEVQFSLKTPEKPPLNPFYTFENFVVGEGNRLAYSAALEVTLHPAQSYNPLFLLADMGLGKTHLLQAMGNLASAKGLRWLYLSAEQFTNEFIFHIREDRAQEFSQRYQGLNLFLVDDVHFLGGKRQTQQSFLATLNQLYETKAQIVVSANRSPEAIPLSPELSSRFQGGLRARLHPLEKQACLNLLQIKTQKMGIQFPLEVSERIAQQGQGNLRALEGALNRVLSLLQFQGGTLDAELVDKALADAELKIGPSEIINLVANYYQIPSQVLLGKSRGAKLSQARQLAILLLKNELGMNLSQIGTVLGLTKSSVLYAFGKATNSPVLEKSVAEIKNNSLLK